MKKFLRRRQRQEHAAVLEAVFRLQNAGDDELAATDRDALARGGIEEFRGALAEPDAVFLAAEIGGGAGDPFRAGEPRVAGLEAEAGDDRVTRRGDEAEEQRVRSLHVRERADAADLRSGDAAEEKIGDVALEDEVVAVDGEDAFEHADGPADDGEDREHRRHAEPDAGDPDQGAQLVAAEVDEHEREKPHGGEVLASARAPRKRQSGW